MRRGWKCTSMLVLSLSTSYCTSLSCRSPLTCGVAICRDEYKLKSAKYSEAKEEVTRLASELTTANVEIQKANLELDKANRIIAEETEAMNNWKAKVRHCMHDTCTSPPLLIGPCKPAIGLIRWDSNKPTVIRETNLGTFIM